MARLRPSLPVPLADRPVTIELPHARAAVRELDALALATGHAGPRIRTLLLPDALAEHGGPLASAERERAVRRFEQAAFDAGRRDRVDVAHLLRAHRRLVPGAARRTGPEVGPLLADLSCFLTRTDLCPVTHAAVAYAQVVTLRPFTTGNGRLARWLLQVVPRRRGLVRRLAPPVGLVLAARSVDAGRALDAFRGGDTDRWCAFLGDVLTAGAADARAVLAVAS
jgi:hypothetical protein